ncbi:PRD domain-containing protein [Thermanaerovibrio acidaminovorans]|jgi:transcriptional antiterminator|uniref:Transcriptional antiterminator, BglG n=1 Tax=Thermanaerovibrio acidaminovorans (strain ATCC 49978 / DSM 6589 / Su883) TaxID=525903 RepID=D1B6P9_THEAS|nr:PRD domain-containing protein [Thermanaerovibrio acidaminovorans]ACZ19690.1 transcriptional antiterminator, BglG [Thermanaerovibrio acidaminovorans DSM 6589]
MLRVSKVLNNNVVIASHASGWETVLVGRGIGFGRKVGDPVEESWAEKVFVLKDPKERLRYAKVLAEIDGSFAALVAQGIAIMEDHLGVPLGERIHASLTDHLFFAVKRLREGIAVRNPFAREVAAMYPKEHAASQAMLRWLSEEVHLDMPDDEAAFVALHVHSAMGGEDLGRVAWKNRVISELVAITEESLGFRLDRLSPHYMRFIRHLSFSIDRVEGGIEGDLEGDPISTLEETMKRENPVPYGIALKLCLYMRNALDRPIPPAEVVYLTIHIHRLYNSKQRDK